MFIPDIPDMIFARVNDDEFGATLKLDLPTSGL
jgi:hypothetical protein